MKHCVITGAAGGIGSALVAQYARAGYSVTGIDVDSVALEAAMGPNNGASICADLTEDADLEKILDELEQKLDGAPKIDVFVHNAGMNVVGRFANMPPDLHRKEVEVNLLAPMILTRGLFAHDLMALGASLVFLSSLSYYVGYPGAAVYAASKDGLASYARSLRAAVAGRGMHVMTVFPGPTRTEMARRCSPEGAGSEEGRMPPGRLAEMIYDAAGRGKSVLVPGRGNRFFAAAGFLFPRITELAMKRAIFDRLPVHAETGDALNSFVAPTNDAGTEK